MRRAAEKARMVFFETMSWPYTPICTSPANPKLPGRSSRVSGSERLGGRRTEHAHHQGLHTDGDAGKTRLAGGQQVWTDSLRVEAYGMVDGLNAMVGVVRAFNADVVGKHASAARLDEELRWIQNKLLDAGGILATVPGQVFKNMPQITAKDVSRLERVIDTCQKDLAPLKEFILPGGGKVPDLLQQARTVLRRP